MVQYRCVSYYVLLPYSALLVWCVSVVPREMQVDPATGKKSEPKLAPDACVRAVDDHDDSVYAAVWSARDAWVHASLSFAGKVVVCQVPAAEKYKILL